MQTCHDYEDGPEISRSNTYIDGDSERKFYRKLSGDVSLHSWGVLNKRVTMDDLGPPVYTSNKGTVKIVH